MKKKSEMNPRSRKEFGEAIDRELIREDPETEKSDHQEEQNKEFIQEQIEIRSEITKQEGTVPREPNLTGARPKYKPMAETNLELRRDRQTEVNEEVTDGRELQSQTEELGAEPQMSVKAEQGGAEWSGTEQTYGNSDKQNNGVESNEQSLIEQPEMKQSLTEQPKMEQSLTEQLKVEQSLTEQPELERNLTEQEQKQSGKSKLRRKHTGEQIKAIRQDQIDVGSKHGTDEIREQGQKQSGESEPRRKNTEKQTNRGSQTGKNQNMSTNEHK